jgi:hypothetical protein
MSSLEGIIESILKRDGSGDTGNTMVVQNHLSQMKLFGIRQGVEIMPEQDDEYDTRKKFIDTLWKQNQLELYLDRLWDCMLTKGQVLLYLRPTKDGTYRIYFYERDQFKPYYNGEGELTEVCIRYSYKERTKFEGVDNTRWLRLRITTDTIEQTQMDTQPSFDETQAGFNTTTAVNSLGFIPCVVVRNLPQGPGQDGIGEFDQLRSQIESLDRMVGSTGENLEFFGSQSLVTTRSLNEVTEAAEGGSDNLNRNVTLTSQGGWHSTGSMSTRNHPSMNNRGGRGNMMRVKKVIGNVAGDERFGYIAPDPITPDHNQHIREQREALHFALGGIDELGLNATATAYEMKAIYGKVSATAKKKCKQLYDHGLCKLFELALAAEEDLFRKSLAAALKIDPAIVNDEGIRAMMADGKIPPNVYGLPPLGNREVKWRWKGPVFEPSPRDVLDKSIVVRNLQELGVRSLEGLKFLYDDKTDKEMETMLAGGYPFRYISSVGGNVAQLMSLYQGMMNVPDASGKAPLAASMPIIPLVVRSLEAIFNELNYERPIDPIQPGDLPEYNPGYSKYAGFLGAVPNSGNGGNAALLPGSTTASPGTSISPGSSLSAIGINPISVEPGQPLQGSIQQNGQPVGSTPEYALDIPAAGSTVSTGAAATVLPTSQLSPTAGIPAGIPADLAVSASQPNSIWQQLFPTVAAAVKPKRSKRK